MLAESETPSTSEDLDPRKRLIVALDCPSLAETRKLVETLGEEVSFYKVGWRTFLLGGIDFVQELRSRGKDVFLDLKMDDIEETVEAAVAILRDKATFLTLQGGPCAARASVKGRGRSAYPMLLSVTLLSSIGESELSALLFDSGNAPEGPLVDRFVFHRAKQAIEAGCDGLIASGESIRMIREKFGGGPIIVSPGIRPAGSSLDDHRRTATPKEAIRWGADYLVVGRPIRMAADPVVAARAILEEIGQAAESTSV